MYTFYIGNKSTNPDIIVIKWYFYWGVKGAPILFSEIGFCVASCSYIPYVYICQDGGAVGFVDFTKLSSFTKRTKVVSKEFQEG